MVCLHCRLLYISYLSSPKFLYIACQIDTHALMVSLQQHLDCMCIKLRAKYFRALDITTSGCSFNCSATENSFLHSHSAFSTREFFRSVESTLFPLLISFSVLRWLLSRSDSLSITSIQVISKTTLILFKPSKVPACFSFADEI